jgi:hypothetical protein
MKTGRTLVDLAHELERQAGVKRDFLIATATTECVPPPADQPGAIRLRFLVGNTEHCPAVRDVCHEQLSAHLGIPKPYYDRMCTQLPVLLADNINAWFRHQPARRLLRTLDNGARAFLSDRYRPLDHHDLADAVLPVLVETPGIEIVSCEVTERRLYLKAVNHRVAGEVAVGDVVQAGVAIANSEVGDGALRIEPLVYRLVCRNGMIAADHGLRRMHTGSRLGGNGEVHWELLRDETKAQSERALWMQVQDLVRAALTQALFQPLLTKLQETTEHPITGDPNAAIEVTAEKFRLTETERKSVLRHLTTGGSLTRWGLVNALTRTAEDVDSYDRATELERYGGQVVELPRRDWERIAQAG